MPVAELRKKIARVRGIGVNLSVQWPLVSLGEGLVGHGERDLGIPKPCFERFKGAVTRALRGSQGHVPGPQLRELFHKACPEAPDLETPQVASLALSLYGLRLDPSGDGIVVADEAAARYGLSQAQMNR